MWYFKRIPSLLFHFFPEAIWQMESGICLTFDDGPFPESTPFILDALKKYQAKATFFLSGQQAELYPELVQCIVDEGHVIGSHGYKHLNAWSTKNDEYIADILKGHAFSTTVFFRPPYGKITPQQYVTLKQKIKGLKTVMFSFMPGDFDQSISPENFEKLFLSKTRNRDIIVLHDHPKALPRLKQALPVWLEKYASSLVNLPL